MPERMAEKVLADLDEAASLPLDIESVIKGFRVAIEWAALTKTVNGIYYPMEEQPVIVCNMALDRRRARFTLAHELYHHLDYITSPAKNLARFYIPDLTTERKANRFAAALLMPCRATCHLRCLGKSDQELADIFLVSRSALEIRLRELGLRHSIST